MNEVTDIQTPTDSPTGAGVMRCCLAIDSATPSDSDFTQGDNGAGHGSALPAHHLRYATAWSLYQDQDELSENSKRALEREMDAAQNLFGRDTSDSGRIWRTRLCRTMRISDRD